MTDNTHNPSEPAEDDEISLLDLLQTIVDNLRLLILGPLVVGLAALGISFAIAPTYTATVKFLPPPATAKRSRQHARQPGRAGWLGRGGCGPQKPR
jgi:LPS O-antigen subunit length determinant protein (WzzB/FepE family)